MKKVGVSVNCKYPESLCLIHNNLHYFSSHLPINLDSGRKDHEVDRLDFGGKEDGGGTNESTLTSQQAVSDIHPIR
uniref:Ovule protein n=1 Tax=Caenorhabditis tropicalis TaxID=1561998 RepID=A0A1I7UP95_9PELO